MLAQRVPDLGCGSCGYVLSRQPHAMQQPPKRCRWSPVLRTCRGSTPPPAPNVSPLLLPHARVRMGTTWQAC
eukprot:360247-Chlamydomonas_euryale.AAC.2